MDGKKIIKETIIMLLVCLVAMLIFAIALYNFIPNRKTVAKITEYVPSESTQALLEDNIDSNDRSEVILSYEVTSTDLKNYQKTKEYVPGKPNPFAKATTTISGEANESNQANSNTTSSETTNTETNNTNSGYYKNTGTK